MTKLVKVSKKNTAGLFKRYKKAQAGVAAIEFVFVAPIMIAMYFGLAEISTAISQDRQISHSANVAGDLATQVTTINATDMSEIMTAAVKIMGVPRSRLSSIQMEIASYSRDSSNNLVTLGKSSLNGTFPENFDAEGLDDLILSEASGVVVARVAYEYEPLKLAFMKTNFTMSETFLLKPRRSSLVSFSDGTTNRRDYTCQLRTDNAVSCS